MPSLPVLFCRKKIGPFDVVLMIVPKTMNKIGKTKTVNMRETTISNARFRIRFNPAFRGSSLREMIGMESANVVRDTDLRMNRMKSGTI